MIGAGVDATNRFHRPIDFRATRRNHRQVQVRRILVLAANVTLLLVTASLAAWLYRRAQSDERFAVERVQAAGSLHTAAADLSRITSRYVGVNLFRLDIESLRRELLRLPWIERVAIEKRLPNTLRIRLFERRPVALLRARGNLRYVDARGFAFAPLSVSGGDAELPLISDAAPADLPRTVAFLEQLRRSDKALYARVSEIQPLAPDAFAVFDRDLRTFVFLGGAGSLEKWKTVYSIAATESYASGGVEYADLRFDDRIIVKPRHVNKVAAATASISTGITN